MVSQALDLFVTQYIDLMNNNNSDLLVEFDTDWISPCYTQEKVRLDAQPDIEFVKWNPVLQQGGNAMQNIGTGLGLNIHDDFSAFFTRYYSLDLPATARRGELSLLQVWNQDDFDRLQKNLIGHVLMKRRLKQPETLFFALTDEDDFIISLENHTGHVVLEQIGKLPCEKLADNMASFISSLTPLAKNLTL